MVDAIYVKARRNQRVHSAALLIACGINQEGFREIIGFEVATCESENSWGEFFEHLKHRCLKAPSLMIYDNHVGLVNAIKRHFTGTTCQRYQTHFSRNILNATPKAIQSDLKDSLRRVYEASDFKQARQAQLAIIKTYEHQASKAMQKLDEAFDDITAVLSLPKHYRKRLRTTNGIERLNQEIRRQERVIRIFPNEASVIRLIGAMLVKHDEKWSTSKQYFDMTKYDAFIASEQAEYQKQQSLSA